MYIKSIKNNAWVTVNNNFWVTSEAIWQKFSSVTKSRVKIIGKSLHEWLKKRCSRQRMYYSIPYNQLMGHYRPITYNTKVITAVDWKLNVPPSLGDLTLIYNYNKGPLCISTRNIKILFYSYRNSHSKYKTVSRLFCLYNGNPHTPKTICVFKWVPWGYIYISNNDWLIQFCFHFQCYSSSKVLHTSIKAHEK